MKKEEEWLNEMALNGWVLDGVGFCTYHFVRCEPGEYAVRLEMHGRDDAYVDFMEETGAEYAPYSRRSANERKPYRLTSSSFSSDCFLHSSELMDQDMVKITFKGVVHPVFVL